MDNFSGGLVCLISNDIAGNLGEGILLWSKARAVKMKRILFIQTNYPGFLSDFDQKSDRKRLSYRQLKSRWNKEWFGQSNFYGKHLKPLGWQTDEVITNDWELQSLWAKENGVGVEKEEAWSTKKLPESIKNVLGTRSWIKKILFAQIKVFKPDVVYIHDLSLLNTDDIKKIKRGGALVVGQIACPLPLDQRPLKEFDLIVSSFPHYIKMFRKVGIKSEYLRWCFEENIARQVGKQPKKYDVVFVGGYSIHHSQGNKVLEELARRVRVDFWGYGEQSLPPTSPIRQNFHGMVWGKKMYQIFAQAKIVVNRHINVAGNVANNMRMFDVTGAGTLLITDSKPNMGEFFEADKEVVTYKGGADLIRKTRYYLSHTAQREKIARAGQKRTLREHTYAARMKELDKILRTHLVNGR